MCGIIGYSGPRQAAPILLDSLQRLEYRGYDSAGIAVLDDDGGPTAVAKSNLKVTDLIHQFDAGGMPRGHTGIGHTRWATHGRPTVVNAHPHRDCTGRIHIIHNGIIENYRELRVELAAAGHEFISDTDTEVVPHLIEQYYAGDLASAVRAALQRIRGAYALVVVSADEDEIFVSSDITALIPYTKRVVLLGEGELAAASSDGVTITSLDGTPVDARVIAVDWEAEQAQKNGFPHFMLKEIHEQPEALRSALRGRIDDGGFVDLPDILLDDNHVRDLRQVTIVACGSAWIAGMVAKYAIEKLARVRCDVEPASEFRYADPLLDEHTLVVAFSQSGETADTLAAVREVRRQGAKVIAVTNVVGSALSMEADGVIYMQSGPEICVAATKTMLNQMACGLLLALRLGQARGVLPDDEHRRLTGALIEAPELIGRALELEPQLAEMAQRYAHTRNAMYIGRGINFPVALEGALKLKEVSYIHAEGYAAGELKHGPIALLDPDVPVVAVATRSRTLAKMVANIQEVSSRDAPVVALVSQGENPFDAGFVRDLVEVPLTEELISPLVNVVPLQLFAYHVAVERGCDVDQPRNLAKSVTVE
jgi:glucosamine--fructose-6-phosphate aminotransferase (isomerizing)